MLLPDAVVQRLLAAEEDPEPLTPVEAAAVDRALDEVRAGQVVSWEEVRARCG